MQNKSIILIIIIIAIILILLVIAGLIVLPSILNSSAQETLNEITDTQDITTDESEEDISVSLEEQAKQVFNQMFTIYETEDDETLESPQVLTLFDTLANHNEQNEKKKIDINGTIVTQENKESLKQIIDKDIKYDIKCVYDDEGYVKTIELRYVNQQEDSSENNTTNEN